MWNRFREPFVYGTIRRISLSGRGRGFFAAALPRRPPVPIMAGRSASLLAEGPIPRAEAAQFLSWRTTHESRIHFRHLP